jgi:DNA helicase MCM8
MEQQSVSVAKSGVVTSLRCRTTVLAAANPVGGHYDRRKSVSENLKLASALLSRFDLVFIMLDRPDLDRDRQISEHVMRMSTSSSRPRNQHQHPHPHPHQPGQDEVPRGESEGGSDDVPLTLTQRLRRSVSRVDASSYTHPSAEHDQRGRGHPPSPPLLSCAALKPMLAASPELLRQYIAYARLHCHPTLSIPAAKVLQRHYLRMRAEAHVSGDGLPVTTRHLESLIRLAQARARLELREVVREQDASDVVDLFNECMLDAVTLDSGEIDFGRKGGMSMAKQVKALVRYVVIFLWRHTLSCCLCVHLNLRLLLAVWCDYIL